MIIRLTIEDDNGEIFWEDEQDACHPFDLKLPNDRPVRGEKHAFFGFVYQPICKAIYREQGARIQSPPETSALDAGK